MGKDTFSIVATVFSVGTAMVSAASAQPATTSSVELTVEEIKPKGGHLRVTLCPEELHGNWSECYRALVPASSKSVSYTFTDVPTGKYILSLYHDANDNGKLDFRFWGPPKEGLANSGNVPARFGPPDPEKMIFVVEEDAVSLTVTMMY